MRVMFVLACLALHFGASAAPLAPPVPHWPPSYAAPTLIMISNQTHGGGFWNDDVFNLTRWGIVDVDGGNAYQIWAKGKPIDNTAAQREQAARLKRANPAQKVWTYVVSKCEPPCAPKINDPLKQTQTQTLPPLKP